MIELKNYLAEKNISVKDFARITKVKEKKLNRVFEHQSYFNNDEATRVSAFLGVSKNELYHGVFERKGELAEVAEQNNLNHFRYYIKNRFKKYKALLNFCVVMAALSTVGIVLVYIALMFLGITGLPTLLRSIDVMLLCFIIPVFGSFLFADFAREKVIGKRATTYTELKIETVGISGMLLIFSVYAFVNDFIPLESLIITVIGAIVLSALSFLSAYKNNPFGNSFVKFIFYMFPTILLGVSEWFVFKYVKEITPEEGEAGEALALASELFSMVFFLLIFVVLYFSLIQCLNVFVKGVGRFFSPAIKTSAITKGNLLKSIIICAALSCATVLIISISQGLYLKYMYTTMFEGQEDTVNWTSELLTDYKTEFRKGEYDVIKFEGMKIKIPKGYKTDKETEYTTIYKNGEYNHIILQKPMYEQSLDFDIFDEDFGDGKLTEKQLQDIKDEFVKYFGFYPKNFYEWQKLNGMVTLDDIDVFNPRKTALLSAVFIMKATASFPGSEYYLYENDGLYATITIRTVENKEKGNKEFITISFGSTDLEYGLTLAQPDQNNDITIEQITKILNSVNVY